MAGVLALLLVLTKVLFILIIIIIYDVAFVNRQVIEVFFFSLLRILVLKAHKNFYYFYGELIYF